MPGNNNSNYLSVAIVTPEGKVYESNEVKVVVAPATLGEVAILPKHAPLFTRLQPGEVKIKTGDKDHVFAVFGGFMDVNPEGQVTVLADFAKRSEEIDFESTKKAKEEAERLMQNKPAYSKDEYARIELTLKQALFAVRIAEKVKRKRTN